MEDVALEQGVSKHTVYAWKAKYGSIDVSETDAVRHLREENPRLKKLVVGLSLDKDMLQSVIRSIWSAARLQGEDRGQQPAKCLRPCWSHAPGHDEDTGVPVLRTCHGYLQAMVLLQVAGAPIRLLSIHMSQTDSGETLIYLLQPER